MIESLKGKAEQRLHSPTPREIALRFDGVDVRLNTKVARVEHNSVELSPGERQEFDAIVERVLMAAADVRR